MRKHRQSEELLARGISTRTESNLSLKPAFTKRKTPTTMTKEGKGFIFELQSGKKSGKNTSCSFLVTSKEQDKELRIHGKADYRSSGLRIADDLGNEYLASQIQFGGYTEKYAVNKMLPTDVPIRASLNFENISPKANGLLILEIDTNVIKYQFRNIGFSN